MRVIIVQPRFITTYTSLRKGREFGLCYSAWAGDQVWRKINTSNNAKHFVDAIYFQNQFYAIDAFGLIFAVKDDDGTTTRVAELPTEFIEDVVEYLYVVESEDGTLFVVSRRGVQVSPTHLGYLTEENTYTTLGFQVFESI